METRTYPLPTKYIGTELLIIETPGKLGKFQSRIVGVIRFGKSFRYRNAKEFAKDEARHKVTKDSPWAWMPAKPKWGWPIEKVTQLRTPITYNGRKGIRFTTSVRLQTS